MNSNPLPIDFYNRDTHEVAKALLGMILVRTSDEGVTAGRIVETEAYVTGDPANHASRGKTRRNAVMFGPPGHAYIYRIHQCYCLNAVTRPKGIAEAVLIRALEPIEGVEVMRLRRGSRKDKDLTNGPGKLCQAFALTTEQNGLILTRPPLMIVEGEPVPDRQIVSRPRVGIRKAAEFEWRYYIAGSPCISKK